MISYWLSIIKYSGFINFSAGMLSAIKLSFWDSQSVINVVLVGQILT